MLKLKYRIENEGDLKNVAKRFFEAGLDCEYDGNEIIIHLEKEEKIRIETTKYTNITLSNMRISTRYNEKIGKLTTFIYIYYSDCDGVSVVDNMLLIDFRVIIDQENSSIIIRKW